MSAQTHLSQDRRYAITVNLKPGSSIVWKTWAADAVTGSNAGVTATFLNEADARTYANRLWTTGGVDAARQAQAESDRFNREWAGFKNSAAAREAEQEVAAYLAESSCENYDGECIHFGGSIRH